MDTHGRLSETLDHRRGRRLKLRDQLASIRIAQHQVARPASHRRLKSRQCILRAVGETVVEMFRVVNDFPSILDEVANRVLDHRKVLFGRGPQNVGHMEKPGLSKNRHDRGFRFQQEPDLGVLFNRHPGPTGRAEGGHPTVLQPQPPDLIKIGHVPRIRTGPAALDIINTELIEPLGNQQLVRYGERDALSLGSIAQCGIVDLYGILHQTKAVGNSRPDQGPEQRCRVSPAGGR